MKRKFAEGISGFCGLEKNYQLGNFLRPLLLKYRGYGYFCQGEYEVIVLLNNIFYFYKNIVIC